ncbi:hypothetical protein ACLIYN_24950, partial [Streptomyces atacamensis]
MVPVTALVLVLVPAPAVVGALVAVPVRDPAGAGPKLPDGSGACAPAGRVVRRGPRCRFTAVAGGTPAQKGSDAPAALAGLLEAPGGRLRFDGAAPARSDGGPGAAQR